MGRTTAVTAGLLLAGAAIMLWFNASPALIIITGCAGAIAVMLSLLLALGPWLEHRQDARRAAAVTLVNTKLMRSRASRHRARYAPTAAPGGIQLDPGVHRGGRRGRGERLPVGT